MSSFWKNAGIMATAEIFLKLKAFIMLPLVSKYLGTMNYGIWSQVMVIVALLNPLVFYGMENSLARYLPGQPLADQKRDFTGWLLFGTVTSILLLFVLMLCSTQFSDLFFGTADNYPIFVVLAGFNLVTTSVLNGMRYWLRIQDSAWHLVVLTVAQNIMQMLALILVLVVKGSIYDLVLWTVITDAVLIAITAAFMAYKNVFVKPSFSWLRPYFKFGIVLVPSGYAIWVLNSLDRVFLAQYHTLSDIGVYSICFTLGYTLIQVFVNPIWSLFPTKAAELYNLNKLHELSTLFNQSIKLICWIVFPSILGLLVVGNHVLMLLTTEEFAHGSVVIPIILGGYLALMLSSYFETILSLRHKQVYSTYLTVIAAIVNIVLNFLLIPKYSYFGAAAATSLSFGLQLILSMYLAGKENVITLHKFVIAKITASSLIMYGILYSIQFMFTDVSVLMTLIFMVSLGAILYSGLSMIFKIYHPKDIISAYKGAI